MLPRYFLPFATKSLLREHWAPFAPAAAAETEEGVEGVTTTEEVGTATTLLARVIMVVGRATPPVPAGMEGAGAPVPGAEPEPAPAGRHCEYHGLKLLHSLPDAQVLSPVKPLPPHWP